MSKSRYGALGAALKEKKGVSKETPAQKVTKSKNPDYAQTTVYLHRKEVYVPLQSALTAERLEYSQLVEDLLREWLKNRKRSNV